MDIVEQIHNTGGCEHERLLRSATRMFHRRGSKAFDVFSKIYNAGAVDEDEISLLVDVVLESIGLAPGDDNTALYNGTKSLLVSLFLVTTQRESPLLGADFFSRILTVLLDKEDIAEYIGKRSKGDRVLEVYKVWAKGSVEFRATTRAQAVRAMANLLGYRNV